MMKNASIAIAMEHDASACTKKSRKPYTLTKQRESWTNDEHERFIKALQLYNRDWKKIESYVGTKTVVQIRSHAQKYFQKVIKSGSTDAIPPPRPKRRATDPPLASQASCVLPDTKQLRVMLEGPARANSVKGEVDSDEVQHNSKHDLASLRLNDAVDAPIQLESARAVVSSQHLQHVYLFLASMFSQTPANHTAMLAGLSDRDRQLVTRLLKILGEELATQQQQLQQSTGQLQQQQCATHAEDQQLQQQQVTPAIPGAQAAQDLAATVQESISNALKQLLAAAETQQQTLQDLNSASMTIIKLEQDVTGVLGAEATNADQDKAAAAATAAAEASVPDSTPITDTGQPAAVSHHHQQDQQLGLDSIANSQATGTETSPVTDAQQHVGSCNAGQQSCPAVSDASGLAVVPKSTSLVDVQQQQDAGQLAALQQQDQTAAAAAAAPAGDFQQVQHSNAMMDVQGVAPMSAAAGMYGQISVLKAQLEGTDLQASTTRLPVCPHTLCQHEGQQQPALHCVGTAAAAAGGGSSDNRFEAYDLAAPLN